MADAPDVRNAVEVLVDWFMAEVVQAAREAALDSLAAALGPEAVVRLRDRASRTQVVPATEPVPIPRSRTKGAKRPHAELVGIVDRVRAFVAAHPGLRVEQINQLLGTTTREVALPLRKLVHAGELRTEGVKRSTVYYTSGTRPDAPPASRPAGVVAPRRRSRAS
jgi:hypothetical protein